jgi:hypothetical protein
MGIWGQEGIMGINFLYNLDNSHKLVDDSTM